MADEKKQRIRKITRQFKRYLKAGDAEEKLFSLATYLAASRDLDSEMSEVDVLFHFSDFISAVENAYLEYEDKIKYAIRNIELSSKELNNAYDELNALNVSVNAMLDSLGQGLLFFDANGLCSDVFSKSCHAMLGGAPAGRHVADVLNLNAEERMDFDTWLSVAFDEGKALIFEDLASLAPEKMVNGEGRIIALDYRPMLDEKSKRTGVLLIATDKTFEIQAQREIEEVRNTAEQIRAIAMDRGHFKAFVLNVRAFLELFSQRCAEPESRIRYMQQLHSFKGVSSYFSLTELVSLFHETEELLKNESGQGALHRKIGEIEERLQNACTLAERIFGADFLDEGGYRLVHCDDIAMLKQQVYEVIEDPAARHKVLGFINEKMVYVPFRSGFAMFEAELRRIAENQGKLPPEVAYAGDNPEVLPEFYEAFFETLPHLARNIVDHGLEIPAVRRATEKREQGRVTITSDVRKGDDGDRIRLTIADDGAGVDLDRVRRKLSSAGRDVESLTEHDVLEAIFLPEFSTVDVPGLISGRGVGLSAIRQAAEDIGGTVSVDSRRGCGTHFIIDLPYKK